MSSMVVRRVLAPALLVASVAAVASTLVPEIAPRESPAVLSPAPSAAPRQAPVYDAIAGAIAEWSRLRQSDGFAFADYARFLIAHPGWPGESAMRRAAERRLLPDGAPAEIIAFFTRYPALTNTGRVRYAEALAGAGRTEEARAAARAAWTAGALSPDDETRLMARFPGAFTSTDHDQRMERLLWDGATTAAARQIAWTSAARRPLYEARLAMQLRRPDAGDKAALAGPGADRDPGYRADRARWLRDASQSAAARAYLAAPRVLDAPPYDPGKWLDLLLGMARGANNDGQWSTAYDIARQVDDAFPAGASVRDRSLDERDDYTSLVWLGGTIALKKLGRPADAVGLFDRYARAAQTPQTQSKGWYWAARAAEAAGDGPGAQAYLAQAAVHVDQFYGQLAAERLGRVVTIPAEPPAVVVAGDRRAAFAQSEIVRAARYLGSAGAWRDQTQFIRVIAQNAKTDADHVLADELARAIGRPDLGVMVSRFARNNGARDPVRIGFPQVAVPPTQQYQWVMIHAITRQESQFDRQAVSHAGARGLMQLMPATAQEQAGKLGLAYDYARLIDDPSYNVMLGSAFFQRLLDYYGGSHVLAVASYNAGPGNVNKWLKANGDPRLGVDVIDWIEAIPITETRGYVQRVLENAVMYDMLNPARARMPAQNRLSAYLGKRTAG